MHLKHPTTADSYTHTHIWNNKALNIARIKDYRQVSNISGTLAGDKIVDHSDVVGASPVGAAPTTSSFST